MAKKDWTKILKSKTASKGSDPFKKEITPYRDWRILAGVFFVALVASLGFNIYMSIEINGDNFFNVTPVANADVMLNKDGLDKILASFADKAAAFDKTKTGGVPVVDPSL